MTLRVGDRVKTDKGERGKIVTLTRDGIAAYVQLDDNKPGKGITVLRLDSLTKIEVGKTD